ncbi:MAG: hypothetical protein NTY76_01115 [Candidatus Omnitrophica bacterium]|nr:hypothetical protein [Candidatus Omnitrophota bacterium]
MSTLTRFARMAIVLTLVMDFFVFGTLAETATSYSCQYTADLEQKQMLLESIREDTRDTENGLQENINKVNTVEKEKTSCLKVENIDLARIMPPTEKINVALVGMNGTLSPESGRDRFSQDRDKTRN